MRFVLAMCLVLLTASEGSPSHPRAKVGLMPEGFVPRAVSEPRAVRQYAEAYIQALGISGLEVTRVAALKDRYYVYVVEISTGRGAFTLEVSLEGRIAPRRFPGMNPEMMWNQKYGHRARRDPTAVRERLTPEQALERVKSVLPPAEGLRVGSWEHYYGYVLVFLFDPSGAWAGEAAVNTANGETVWSRFPQAPPAVFPPEAAPSPDE